MHCLVLILLSCRCQLFTVENLLVYEEVEILHTGRLLVKWNFFRMFSILDPLIFGVGGGADQSEFGKGIS